MKEILLKKYAHLASAYNSYDEFVEHFFGGEVTIPVKDLLDIDVVDKSLVLKAFEAASPLSKKGKIYKLMLSMFEKENNIRL